MARLLLALLLEIDTLLAPLVALDPRTNNGRTCYVQCARSSSVHGKQVGSNHTRCGDASKEEETEPREDITLIGVDEAPHIPTARTIKPHSEGVPQEV